MSRQLKEDRVTANLSFFFIEIDKFGIPPKNPKKISLFLRRIPYGSLRRFYPRFTPPSPLFIPILPKKIPKYILLGLRLPV